MGMALEGRGHHAVVLTGRVPGLPEVSETESGTVCRLYDRKDIGTPAFTQCVLGVARRHKVDWIEGADHWGEAACLLGTGRRDRLPVVVKVHSSTALGVLWKSQILYPWQWPFVQLARMRVWRRVRDERRCLFRADALMTPSVRILDELRKQSLPLPSRCATIPNPVVPIDGWNNEEAPDPTLLLVGRIDIGKGIQYLPSILRSLSIRHPKLRVEIAGNDTYARGLGSLQRWLSSRCGESGSRLLFLGRLNGDELDAAYRRAWVVIVPSRWDNFPTVVLEAMARGKAIVASPNGGMPEMLQGTSCRIATPATDAFAGAVSALLADATLRSAAGASGREKAERHYAPAAVVPRYIAFLEGVTGLSTTAVG
jgi:glycosyltransferase involved in cell wall biosynthesis